MKLDACGFPLPLPSLVIGVEDSVSQEVSKVVSEVRAFREDRETVLEEMLDVSWVASYSAVEAA